MNDYPREDYQLTKEDWINKYGSFHLKQLLDSGYSGVELYGDERGAMEYPGWRWNSVDPANSPSMESVGLTAMFPGSFVGIDFDYWNECKIEVIAVNNPYHGTYQLTIRPGELRKQLRKETNTPWWRALLIPFMAKDREKR